MSTPEATTEVVFTLEQLRLLAKSVSKTMDAEAKKLHRLQAGSHVHREVKADYLALDSVDVEIRSAIAQLVGNS